MRNAFIYGLFILLMGCVKSNPAPTPPIIPTPVVIIPNVPIDFKGVLSAATQIDLTWTDASNNEDGFKIERKSGTDAYTLLATLSQNVVTYSDKGLTPGTSYTYRIFSYNSKGNSINSNEIAVKTEDAEVALLKVGLVAFYPFTGNAGDSSGNANHGTVTLATLTTDRFNNTNKAYYFNGTNSKIVVNSFDKILGNNPFSVSFWVSPDNGSKGWMVCFGKSSNGNAFECGNWTYGTSLFDASIWKYDYLGQPKTNLDVNIFQNITITYDGQIMKVYKNGTLTTTHQINYVTTNILAGILTFGKQIDFEEYFKGKLDDIRIHNRVLTLQEISYLYTH